MNERIRELMIQSSMVSEVVGNPNGLWTTKMSVKTAEKFAELIVKECAGIVQTYMSRWPEDAELTKQILEHFGVEE